MDLRTGRLLYSYPNLSCTPHHLLPLPPPAISSSSSKSSSSSSPVIRLATVASDAALRIHYTLPPKKEGEKGNLGGGRKARVEGMVGGVGIASFVFKGHREIADPIKEKPKKKRGGDDGDDDDEEGDEGDSDDEEVWDEMSEVEDEGSDESEDEVEVPKKKKSRK
jgi:ribosome biogenesis protein NSA1